MFIDEKEYVSIEEVCQIAGITLSHKRRKHLKTYIVVNRRAYISREEAEELKLFAKEYVTIEEANKITGLKISDYNRKHLKTYIVLSRKGYISREEAEELKLFAEEYVAIEDICEIAGLKISNYSRKHLKTYIVLNQRGYISREEAEELKLFAKDNVTIEEANKIAGFMISHKRRKHLKTYKVMLGKSYISREEVEELKPSKIPSEELFVEGKKYIPLSKAEEMLGLKKKFNYVQRNKLRTYITINHESSLLSHSYVQLVEIEELLKFREDLVSVTDLGKSLFEWSYSAVFANIRKLGIEKIKAIDNFWGYDFINKKDAEKLKDSLRAKSNVEEAMSKGDGLSLYRIYKNDTLVKPEVARTMSSFDDYVVKRFSGEVKRRKGNKHHFKSKGSRNLYARTFANVYQILLDTFAMDFERYEEETVNEMVALALKGKGKKETKEFIWFLNDLIDRLSLKRTPWDFDLNEGKNRKEKQKGEANPDEVYSQEHFIKLWWFLHSGVKNGEYILKALDNRFVSQKWLYMYLHFNTLWRQGDMIKNLPTPNLSLLGYYGITDGESLFKWLREDKNVFTDEMGMVITESVKSQVKAFELKISKTNHNLFIEVGRLMAPV